MTERIFLFTNGDGTKGKVTLDAVGFKAFNLIRMAKIGLPVPPAFVISTEFCREYYSNNKQLPPKFVDLLIQNIQKLERITGYFFGAHRNPLLVSVRSGAAVSMPGMMSTILNIGLSDETLSGLLRMTGNPRFVWDSYRRLIQFFSEVVYGYSQDPYEELLEKKIKKEEWYTTDELDTEALKEIVNDYLYIFSDQAGFPFPQCPIDQLQKAIGAIFRSWESPRCMEYRRIHNIVNLPGTAITVQTMVFGNMGLTSGSGVAFTRNPSTGRGGLYGEFLFNAQGEEIVSGKRTPKELDALTKFFPQIQRELNIIGKRLEAEFRDMQEFEFTIQEGDLFILQTRNSKRTPWAALQIAVDMVNEGLISKEIALERLDPYQLSDIKRTKIVSGSSDTPIEAVCSGISVSPGVVIGEIIFNSEDARNKSSSGRPLILVRDYISTSDLVGISLCEGILTSIGGKTSHAAVIARQMNKVCIVGCTPLMINAESRSCRIGNKVLKEGESVSLDGNSGRVFIGRVKLETKYPENLLSEVQGWKMHR